MLRLLPNTIFTRFLVIIITPVILAQIIAIYVFYQRHWSNVSNYMIENLSNDISLLAKMHQDCPDQIDLINKVSDTLKLRYYLKNSHIARGQIEYDSELEDFYNSLTSKINLPLNLNYNSNKNEIEIEIDIGNNTLNIITSRKKIDNPTTYIFILWMTGTTTILTILSILFLRNQIKSISKLANVADKFGKGIKIENFKPSGALEIRNAGRAFLKMKERIERQIAQRTFMLSAVSHDLKTPITRMKLELEMVEQNSQIMDIKQDISEMEKMINHYLDFAKGEDGESSQMIDITILIKSILENYKNSNISIRFNTSSMFEVFIRPESMKRAIINLFDNAIRYAFEEVIININSNNRILNIEIIDDGPGIDNSQKELVFKPFYRIDTSRQNKGGNVGLGMAIAKDIVNSHGGEILLNDNSPKGLRVIIKLPI